MFTTCVHRRSPHPHAPGVALCGAGLALLLASLCEVAAQDLPGRTSPWAGTPLTGRRDEGAASTSFDVAAVRRHPPAPAGAPPGLDQGTSRPPAGDIYRNWTARGRTDVDIGSLGYVVPSAEGSLHASATGFGLVPTSTLRVRHPMSDEHRLFAGASGTHGHGVDGTATHVGSKVSQEWKPSRSTLGFELGALGLKLDSDYRLSLRARRGGLVLYLRGRF